MTADTPSDDKLVGITTVTTHWFQTEPQFHSQILQMQCLALLYMSQNFFYSYLSEHIKAKSTIHDCHNDKSCIALIPGIENLSVQPVRIIVSVNVTSTCWIWGGTPHILENIKIKIVSVTLLLKIHIDLAKEMPYYVMPLRKVYLWLVILDMKGKHRQLLLTCEYTKATECSVMCMSVLDFSSDCFSVTPFHSISHWLPVP